MNLRRLIDDRESVSMAAVLAKADALLPDFLRAMDAMPAHERGRGGILESELFLFYCVVRPMKPRRILESGRDLGWSTLTLAHCFPDVGIVSVEHNAGSPNAEIAVAKLAPYRNVECLFGDSRSVLPRLLEPGDPVLIDGPKEFRALKLALRLLRARKASVVFLHDFVAGLPSRRFLDRHWPGAFFSDDPEFIRRFGWLENPNQTPRPTTFACLPARLPGSYHLLLTKIVVARAVSQARGKLEALFRKVFP